MSETSADIKRLWETNDVVFRSPSETINYYSKWAKGDGVDRNYVRLSLSQILVIGQSLQYRHLIPAPVDRTYASACSFKNWWITCQK